MFILQLEKQHSAVLKDLMVFLRELLKDYKNEVQGENINHLVQ